MGGDIIDFFKVCFIVLIEYFLRFLMYYGSWFNLMMNDGVWFYNGRESKYLKFLRIKYFNL